MGGIELETNEGFWKWIFAPIKKEATPGNLWLWWQERRLAYNVIVILTAACSLLAFEFFCGTSGKLSPSDDAAEPVGIILGAILGPILWNCAYCLGPVVDIASQIKGPRKHLAPLLLKDGMGFSILILCIPSATWMVIWIVQAFRGFPKDY